MSTLNVRGLGDYIRDQRVVSQISLRQLARQAGVSNPYLSQIERGLRKPSAEILQQIAKALRISAEALYVQAGILDERDAEGSVPATVLSDRTISERQKQVLLEIYDSFRKENDARALAESAIAEAPNANVELAPAAPTLVVPGAPAVGTAPAKAAAAKKAPASKAAGKKVADKAAVAGKATATKAPAKKPAAKKVPATKAPASEAPESPAATGAADATPAQQTSPTS